MAGMYKTKKYSRVCSGVFDCILVTKTLSHTLCTSCPGRVWRNLSPPKLDSRIHSERRVDPGHSDDRSRVDVIKGACCHDIIWSVECCVRRFKLIDGYSASEIDKYNLVFYAQSANTVISEPNTFRQHATNAKHIMNMLKLVYIPFFKQTLKVD